GIGHLFDVAMVSGDQRFAADLVQRGLDAADALVQAFHGLDRGLEHPGVTHHVAVGVVDDDDVVTLLLDGLDNAVGDLGGAHFGLQVIGGHAGRGNQDALFAFEGLFPTTGEEEGDVGILLGLGDAQLGLALFGQVFAQHVVQRRGREGAGGRNVGGILG